MAMDPYAKLLWDMLEDVQARVVLPKRLDAKVTKLLWHYAPPTKATPPDIT